MPPTSGKSGFKDKRKTVVDFAIPGMVFCMANKRCMAVVVKKPKIIIKLIVREFSEAFFASALNCLYWKPGHHVFRLIRKNETDILLIIFAKAEIVEKTQRHV